MHAFVPLIFSFNSMLLKNSICSIGSPPNSIIKSEFFTKLLVNNQFLLSNKSTQSNFRPISDNDLTNFDITRDFSDMKANYEKLGYTCK